MKTPEYLQKIDEKLKSFVLDKDNLKLIEASHLLMDLIAKRRRIQDKKFAKRFSGKIQSLIIKFR